MNWRVVLSGLGILIALKAEGWRLRAERRVQNALTYAEDIIATVQQPLVVLDAELRVQRANHSFYQFFGVSEEETVNRFVYELGSGQWNIPRLRELLEDVILQNHTFNNFGVEYDFPGIGQKSMLLNARRVRQSTSIDNRLILLAIEDITEQKRAETALLASELGYRRLFESARDGILIIDFNTGEIVEANPFMETLLGYSREELVGRDLWQTDLFGDSAAGQQMFQELQQEGYIRHEHLPLVARDGQVIEVEIIGNVYIEGGKWLIQYNIRDITQRKQAEAELRRNEERLRKIVASDAVGVLFFDEVTGRLLDANDTFLRINGYSRDQVETGELDWQRMTPRSTWRKPSSKWNA